MANMISSLAKIEELLTAVAAKLDLIDPQTGAIRQEMQPSPQGLRVTTYKGVPLRHTLGQSDKTLAESYKWSEEDIAEVRRLQTNPIDVRNVQGAYIANGVARVLSEEEQARLNPSEEEKQQAAEAQEEMVRVGSERAATDNLGPQARQRLDAMQRREREAQAQAAAEVSEEGARNEQQPPKRGRPAQTRTAPPDDDPLADFRRSETNDES